MSKKVTFGGKPSGKPVTPEAWVAQRPTEEADPGEATKRLTCDVPASLHRRIKTQCAAKGVKMSEALRELLERHFPEQS